MAKPYDATVRTLTQLRPADWVAFLNLPQGAVTLLDTDLSTVTLAADHIIRVDAASPYLLHLEFETGESTSQVPARLHQYSTTASAKYGLPVVSVVFLLRRASDSPRIAGIYQKFWPDG